MLFHGLVLRKLSSLLRPWLREEPDLELSLGLVRSLATVKSLRFDVLELNRLVGDSSLLFEEFTVEHLAVRFSAWSAPAFSIEVSGVHVTLSTRETDQEKPRRARSSHDGALRELKKVLSLIDPEGSYLHTILERILVASSSRSKIATSLLNLSVRQGLVQMLDINVKVRFPGLNNPVVCSLNMKEVNSLSKDPKHGSLVRTLFGAVLSPMNESSFTISGSGIEIGYMMNDSLRIFCVLDDLYVSIKLHDLQIVDLSIRVPELSFLFSPSNISVLVAAGKLSSEENRHARSGRQLWRIAAGKIGLAISSPILSLQNLVSMVIIWLQYVNTYEYLLSLVRYPSEKFQKLSIFRNRQNAALLLAAKCRWDKICEIEKELPAEAVAQGRRVARYRASLNVQQADDAYEEPSIYKKFFHLSRYLLFLANIWMAVCKIFQSLRHLFSSRPMLPQEPEVEINKGVDTEELFPEFRLTVNLQKVFIIISPEKTSFPIIRRPEARTSHVFSDFVSFCFSFNEVLVIYAADVSAYSLIISCGEVKIESSSFGPSHSLRETSRDLNSYLEGNKKWKGSNLQTLLNVEPAELDLHSEINNGHHGDPNEAVGHLKTFLREMWLKWNKNRLMFEGSQIKYSESPCFICETRSCLISKDLDAPDSGFWSFNLLLGKLNIAFAYSSIVSIVLLFNQIQFFQHWTAESESARVVSCYPRTNDDQQGSGSGSFFEFYINKLKMATENTLPEKHIQVAIFISGPHVQMSLEKDVDKNVAGATRQTYSDIAFDFHTIEFLVWPTPKRDITLKVFGRSENDREWPWFPDLQPVEIPKRETEKYASRGSISMRSYMKIYGFATSIYSMADQRCQIIVLKPVTICMSSLRESVYSFNEAVTGLSNAVNGLAMGVVVVSKIDELETFFQLVLGLSSALSDALNISHSLGYSPDRGLMRSDVHVEYDNEMFPRNSLIYPKTFSAIDANMKLKSVDVIIQVSRDENKNEGLIELPDWGIWSSVLEMGVEIAYQEDGLQIHVHLSEFCSVLFNNQHNILKNFDPVIPRHLLLKSHNCLSEASLSKFSLTMFLDCLREAPELGNFNNVLGESSAYWVENLLETNESNSSNDQTHRCNDKLGCSSDCSVPNSTNWIRIILLLSGVVISSCPKKNLLARSHPSTKLSSLLSVGRNFQSVSWVTEGGPIILEPASLVMFVLGVSSHLDHIVSMVSLVQTSGEVLEKADDDSSTSGLGVTIQEVKLETPEAFSIKVSQFAICFVGEDDAGGIRELVLETDLQISLELITMHRRFIYKMSRFSAISQVLEGVGKETSIPHFSPTSNVPSRSMPKASVQAFQNSQVICSDGNASFSRDIGSGESQDSCLGYKTYILKQLSAFLSIKKPENCPPPRFNQTWAGEGSVSGFDITISLTELQIILSMLSCLSRLSKRGTTKPSLQRQGTTNPSQQRQWSNNQVTFKSFEAVVPDGAIVAIQDVQQHLYFTVGGGPNMYALAGVLHYSLVGERALFKVKYHKHRRWGSSVLCFSLTSLYAKNNEGEPLRLNHHPGSDLVGISGTHDNSSALWQTSSCKSENYKSYNDWEPYHKLVKDTFYLVNMKRDNAVAFIDGLPEFVRKPGNSFKFKVFQDNSVVRNITTSPHPEANHDEGEMSLMSSSVPCINVTVDGVAWTIVHELSETSDRLPLLHFSMDISPITVQILSAKARIISILKASISYFDTQKNLWREFLNPVEVCTFYRGTFQSKDSGDALNRIPVHVYSRTGKWEISLTELSMDILLFVIGKLDLAGPFSVKSSAILANCCKIENHSGLPLLCHFSEKQTVVIGRKQAASIFLRKPRSR